jgi:hypothetical protein
MTALLSILLNPRLLLAVGLLASAVGAYLWVDHRGYARGAAATEATWQAREAEELARANAEIEKLNREARARETAYADGPGGGRLRLRKGSPKCETYPRCCSGCPVRAGKLVLRDPGAAPCQGAGAGRPGEAPAGAGRRDGAAGSQIHCWRSGRLTW